MHICMDFAPELLRQADLDKQAFAVDLVSHLSVQYALPKSFSTARLAVNVLSTLLSGIIIIRLPTPKWMAIIDYDRCLMYYFFSLCFSLDLGRTATAFSSSVTGICAVLQSLSTAYRRCCRTFATVWQNCGLSKKLASFDSSRWSYSSSSGGLQLNKPEYNFYHQ